MKINKNKVNKILRVCSIISLAVSVITGSKILGFRNRIASADEVSTAPVEKLLYTLDFTNPDDEFRGNTNGGSYNKGNYDYTSSLENEGTFYERSICEKAYIADFKTKGWDCDFNVGDFSSVNNHGFYQLKPGNVYDNTLFNDFYDEERGQGLFFCKLEQNTMFNHAVSENETRMKIIVEPAEFYYNTANFNPYLMRGRDYQDYIDYIESNTEIISRASDSPLYIAINNEYYMENQGAGATNSNLVDFNLKNCEIGEYNNLGFFDVDISTMNTVSIKRPTSQAMIGDEAEGNRVSIIYKIEVYGYEEASAPVEDNSSNVSNSNSSSITASDSKLEINDENLNKIDSWFNKLGLGGLALGTEVVVLLGAVIIVVILLKRK